MLWSTQKFTVGAAVIPAAPTDIPFAIYFHQEQIEKKRPKINSPVASFLCGAESDDLLRLAFLFSSPSLCDFTRPFATIGSNSLPEVQIAKRNQFLAKLHLYLVLIAPLPSYPALHPFARTS